MVKIFCVWGTVFFLLGCAGVAPQSDSASRGAVSSESQVSAKAEARWQALIAKDLDKAYEFLSPGSKSAYTVQLYKGMIRPLDWRTGKALSASCEGEKCSVKVQITFFHQRAGGELGTVLTETWIKDAGNWWYVF